MQEEQGAVDTYPSQAWKAPKPRSSENNKHSLQYAGKIGTIGVKKQL